MLICTAVIIRLFPFSRLPAWWSLIKYYAFKCSLGEPGRTLWSVIIGSTVLDNKKKKGKTWRTPSTSQEPGVQPQLVFPSPFYPAPPLFQTGSALKQFRFTSFFWGWGRGVGHLPFSVVLKISYKFLVSLPLHLLTFCNLYYFITCLEMADIETSVRLKPNDEDDDVRNELHLV